MKPLFSHKLSKTKKGEITMSKKDRKFAADLPYEGKDQTFLDVDRFINEGMSGGSVHNRKDYKNIEEARELVEEAPPNENE